MHESIVGIPITFAVITLLLGLVGAGARAIGALLDRSGSGHREGPERRRRVDRETYPDVVHRVPVRS
ncbi:hypothetical protein GCM10027416_32180 [Okibacterium endophyticum]